MRASVIAQIPIWAFHGEADPTVPVTESRDMIAAIRKAGGNPRYTEYKGVGHEVWLKAFQEKGLVEWLFAQHK
jgi:predicted peptidase